MKSERTRELAAETRHKNKEAVFEEFGTTGKRQHITASGGGIRLRAVLVDRVLGVEQVRGQAAALTMAADYAEAHGCPPTLMEPQ